MNHILVALKKLQKVYLIPEPLPGQEGQFTELSEFKGKKMLPQDVILEGNTLLVLDLHRGIYIFDLVGGMVSERDFIPHDTLGGNYKFTLYQHSLFISFNDMEGSKVTEISFDIEHN